MVGTLKGAHFVDEDRNQNASIGAFGGFRAHPTRVHRGSRPDNDDTPGRSKLLVNHGRKLIARQEGHVPPHSPTAVFEGLYEGLDAF